MNPKNSEKLVQRLGKKTVFGWALNKGYLRRITYVLRLVRAKCKGQMVRIKIILRHRLESLS